MTDTTKLQRWLDLIAYLVGRRQPVSVDEILEHVPAYASPLETRDVNALDASRKMFERDKRELRAFGIPLETVAFAIGGAEAQEGYRLERKSFYLPYLRLLESTAPTKPATGERLLGVAELLEAEVVDPVLVPDHELVERAAAARLRAPHELLVARRLRGRRPRAR